MHHSLRCHTARTHSHLTPKDDAAHAQDALKQQSLLHYKLRCLLSSSDMPGTPLDKPSVHTASEGGWL